MSAQMQALARLAQSNLDAYRANAETRKAVIEENEAKRLVASMVANQNRIAK